MAANSSSGGGGGAGASAPAAASSSGLSEEELAELAEFKREELLAFRAAKAAKAAKASGGAGGGGGGASAPAPAAAPSSFNLYPKKTGSFWEKTSAGVGSFFAGVAGRKKNLEQFGKLTEYFDAKTGDSLAVKLKNLFTNHLKCKTVSIEEDGVVKSMKSRATCSFTNGASSGTFILSFPRSDCQIVSVTLYGEKATGNIGISKEDETLLENALVSTLFTIFSNMDTAISLHEGGTGFFSRHIPYNDVLDEGRRRLAAAAGGPVKRGRGAGDAGDAGDAGGVKRAAAAPQGGGYRRSKRRSNRRSKNNRKTNRKSKNNRKNRQSRRN